MPPSGSLGGSASITSISIQSGGPRRLNLILARAPTPLRGPEHSQSTSMWSVNGSWLASTSMCSYTRSGPCGTSIETATGFMEHSVRL